MNMFTRRRHAVAGVLVLASFAGAAHARPNIVPDNGGGSAFMPPFGLTYLSIPHAPNPSGDMRIVDGLPPGSPINIDASLGNFSWTPPNNNVQSFPGVQTQFGGSLGGEQHAANGTLAMPMIGTGVFLGFNRLINVPVGMEIHTAPRTPFAPVQSFTTDMFRFFGQVTGDPDFDLLRIVAGTDFGLPSPGQTLLTSAGPGFWAVDSFFDITYRIDFVGAPGGTFAGMSGSTTATVRIAVPTPGAAALLGLGGLVVARRRR